MQLDETIKGTKSMTISVCKGHDNIPGNSRESIKTNSDNKII